MKNSANKRVVNLSFDQALSRACSGPPGVPDLTQEFFLDHPEYRKWIKDFAQKHRGDLETLYVKHGVPPLAVLEQIGMCEFAKVPRTAPALFRSRKLLLEKAATIDQAADDLAIFADAGCSLHGVPHALCSADDLRIELKERAAAIRDMAQRSAAHRPRDVKFTEAALYLTDVFLEHTGQPLWDYTGRLIIDHAVENPTDSVKKAVHAAIKRNPRGSIEKRVAACLSK